jgi:hypothetical protein
MPLMRFEALTAMLSPSSVAEDGDSMFLRNVGIDLQIHTVPKPKTSTATKYVIVCFARTATYPV